MKLATFGFLFSFLTLLLLTLQATGAPMTPPETLNLYVQKLNTHSWDQISPLVSDEVVLIFTEGTFVGKQAAKGAFEKTFKLIQEEIYSLHDITWTVVTDQVATCHYEFRWKGLIQGEAMSGGGRGTTVLRKVGDQWLITHEHLGPYARK